MPLRVTIEAVGHKGDGIAHTPGGMRLFIPGTLAGDVAEVALGKQTPEGTFATVEKLITPGPGRVQAPCPHDTLCGGCSLQHLSDAAQAQFKQTLLTEALARAGLNPTLRPLWQSPPQTRRRVTWHAKHTASGITLGFNQRRSHELTDTPGCLVTDPALQHFYAPLKAILAEVLPIGATADATLTLTHPAPDLVLRTEKPFSTEKRTLLARWATEAGLARLCRAPLKDRASTLDIIAQQATPVLDFSGVKITPPPGGFTQACPQAEAFMAKTVVEGLGKKAKNVADLFSGCGTFTFALAQKAKVLAAEVDEASLMALSNAARAARLEGRITTLKRDLFTMPLGYMELKPFDGVVFDPPRAGAKEQAHEIAKSKVPVVIAVSCNPTTFARDARILTQGGYTLDWVQPVDQFKWSTHLEVVAKFSRK